METAVFLFTVNYLTWSQLILVPDTLEEFLEAAGDKLNIKAAKAFTELGALIDDPSLIQNDEKVFISAGEAFYKYLSMFSVFSFYPISLLFLFFVFSNSLFVYLFVLSVALFFCSVICFV